MNRSEILKRIAILRKLNDDYDVESSYFTIDKPPKLIIVFKTYESMEKYLESSDHEIISEEYSVSYDCKE